jgi:hypothetical protein
LLLLRFVQQHWGEFAVAHSVDPTRLIPNDELRIHLGDFLGDQSVLQSALRIRLEGKREGCSCPSFVRSQYRACAPGS